MILTPAVRDAFDLSKESDKTKGALRQGFGRPVLPAGAPPGGGRQPLRHRRRAITATSWDTHSDNDKGHRDRLAPAARPHADGAGRRSGRARPARIDARDRDGRVRPHARSSIRNLGRDHWPNCWSLALAGGGIKTGQVVGASDERGANVTDRVVTMGDLYATIYKALGIDWTKEIHEPHRPAHQDRQFARRPDR